MESETGRGPVNWHSWGEPAFALARAERKPVLLSVTAPWSAACAAMAATYEDPATALLVSERTVPVHVDADHRPDLADRYDTGGLPGTLFLNARGDVLGGGTFVTPARLKAAIERLRTVDLAATAARESAAPAPASNGSLIDLVFDAFDPVHAGFGTAPKFPLTAPVLLALELYEEAADLEMLDRATRTLDVMGWGPLYDDTDGGFFRCSAHADWSAPQPEKLLAPNIALLDLYVRAGMALGHERWLARAGDVAAWVNRAASAANGAWRVAEVAEPGRQFADGNAAAASAMLRAAGAFEDAELGRRAIEGLERVLLATYRPGQGCAHSATGVRGLLTDQVAMAGSCLDAWEATGNIVYRMMAEELMHYAVRAMWDVETGLFADRSAELAGSDPVALEPLHPFALNSAAAVVLDRIARAVGPDGETFAGTARRVLAALEPRARQYGPLAAHYLLARRAVLR
jgi:uncharacterized protein YyaL (SSP411 family)